MAAPRGAVEWPASRGCWKGYAKRKVIYGGALGREKDELSGILAAPAGERLAWEPQGPAQWEAHRGQGRAPPASDFGGVLLHLPGHARSPGFSGFLPDFPS